MTDNTNKVTISAEPITIPAAQFSRILAAAVRCEYLARQNHLNEEKICRMRAELTRYQTICENRKRTSGAGASAEPQKTTTNADENKADAGVLTIGTEGRVSGGERAGFIDPEREHYKRLEDKYISVSKERDELRAKLTEHAELLQRTEAERVELKAKVDGICRTCVSLDQLKLIDNKLAAAERCIEDIEKLYHPMSESGVMNRIRAYHKEKEAAR